MKREELKIGKIYFNKHTPEKKLFKVLNKIEANGIYLFFIDYLSNHYSYNVDGEVKVCQLWDGDSYEEYNPKIHTRFNGRIVEHFVSEAK